MKVLLIDIDSKIPNLALMKISAYHKSIGDEVGFSIEDPDKVYASVIFKKNRHAVDGLRFFYPNAEIDIGGSGYDLEKKLPKEIEEMTPDYSIYPDCDRYYGFTTRGCIRNCYFCIVHKKEGKFHTLSNEYGNTPFALIKQMMGDDIYETYCEPKFNKIEFLDNNILADKEWFMDLTEILLSHFSNFAVDFNQGLDVRLLDSDIASRLKELKPITVWKFAFDSMAVKDDVLRGIQILRDAGIDARHKIMFYVYCHDDAQIPDAVERCNILKENGVTAYSMINRDAPTKKMISLSLAGQDLGVFGRAVLTSLSKEE